MPIMMDAHAALASGPETIHAVVDKMARARGLTERIAWAFGDQQVLLRHVHCISGATRAGIALQDEVYVAMREEYASCTRKARWTCRQRDHYGQYHKVCCCDGMFVTCASVGQAERVVLFPEAITSVWNDVMALLYTYGKLTPNARRRYEAQALGPQRNYALSVGHRAALRHGTPPPCPHQLPHACP